MRHRRQRQQQQQATAHAYEGRVDPLAYLDDLFDADSGQWVEHKAAAVASAMYGGGELDLQINAGGGGIGGATSFWFDATADGQLRRKLVTGPFDARLRCRIRNTADDANPPVDNFRIAGLAVHDPDRSSTLNYIHIGAGSAAQAGNRVEWKTTDDDGGASNDTSAFNSAAWSGGLLDIDFRLVRRATDQQIFDLSWRPQAGSLLDSAGWTSLVTVDRSDNTTPGRAANGAGADDAVPLPSTLELGATIYSNVTGHNIRMHLQEFRVRSTTA